MPVKEIGDPRLEALFGASDPRDGGVRPTVRLPRKGLPAAAIVGIAFGLGLLLFLVLDARRTRQVEPSVRARAVDDSGAWTAPTPLYIPPAPQPAVVPAPSEPVLSRPAALASTPAPVARTIVQPAPQLVQPPAIFAPLPAPAAPQRVSSGSPLIIDSGGAAAAVGSVAPSGVESSAAPAPRMRASALANQSMTVPQGYLIPAVLETGFDSTKPGFARAIVSRDVRGFDGKNVLIPRGSRLIGDYKSAVGQGQNRAVIRWTRLIRPDGMTIAMDSPVVDTLGRGGVAASVNTHLLARLGDALQSSFEIGRALAGRAASGPVVVVSGNAAAAASQVAAPVGDYVPTLKIAPGKSLSVFVAHDLDFSAAASLQ